MNITSLLQLYYILRFYYLRLRYNLDENLKNIYFNLVFNRKDCKNLIQELQFQ